MFYPFPHSLGRPSSLSQTAYYLGEDCMQSSADLSFIAELMEEQGILPENTRLLKSGLCYDILQASVNEGESGCFLTDTLPGKTIRLVNGDHKAELRQICHYLQQAREYACNATQEQMLEKIHDSFVTGDLEAYKAAQRIWVSDKAPPVETVIGFVEPYRDPLGVRGEFEGIVGIPDTVESKSLNILASMADKLVCRLPWVDSDGDSKGPWEKDLFEPPDFSSVQKSHRARGLDLVDEAEQDVFKAHRFHAYYIWVVLHEILGHGTGRFLTESAPGSFNFDPERPPMNPLTGTPIMTWYRPGQTWTGVFEDIATTVDECRAELVGAYLIDEPEILQLFGFNDESDMKSDDLVYNLYLQLGVDGLRGLQHYDPATKASLSSTRNWGQAHSRAHYAILRHLLRDSNGLYTIICDLARMQLTVKVDRARIIEEGKPSLGRMLLHLHICRCTADKASCRQLYEDLSAVDDDAMQWREIVMSKQDPPLAFCHANTFIHDGRVILKEYEPTPRGILQSWAERQVDEPI
ncbi:conserved hypothetical protein [Aspergillus terreus NIH2624]|uniref:Dipeptidyl peptidase III n=1 Tax=Aspergillus terreus (strain NIH 2624 / FGSC A1156) TaxID=341663 RepID=Q0CPL0_ASPTN|nr:uncharacterized protein ATEG_04374 [Aspergillus terreus NIH2624]EAU34821.1 conserved hypothetical protein [Aspergillus terreus NIH2624]